MAEPFPLSRPLLEAVLADRLSDRFVCELIWSRLGYQPPASAIPPAATPLGAVQPAADPEGANPNGVNPTGSDPAADRGPWRAGPATPPTWAQAFPEAPQLIASRPASVALTRSIAAPHKQLLKQQLGFAGYRIGELYPRRTRRATAVNWLLAHLSERGEALPEAGPLPPLLDPPDDPVRGHPGDPEVG
jgi:hypothetical protein